MHELQMWINHLIRLPLAFVFFPIFCLSLLFHLPRVPSEPHQCAQSLGVPPRFQAAQVLISMHVMLSLRLAISGGKTNEQEVNKPNKKKVFALKRDLPVEHYKSETPHEIC